MLEQTIARFGYVVNDQPFSDLSLVLTREVSATNLQPLQEALAEVLQLDEEPMLPAEPAAACVVFMLTSAGAVVASPILYRPYPGSFQITTNGVLQQPLLVRNLTQSRETNAYQRIGLS